MFLCSAQMIQPIFHPANSPYLWQSFCIVSRETMFLEKQLRAVRRIASLSACVLFAGGCVVRIGYESFSDFGFSEFFLFLEWRTAVHFVSLRFQYYTLQPLLRRAACPPFLKDALPFCPFGTFPHTVGNHPPRRAESARPLLPAARIFEPLCKFIRSFLLLLPANPLGLPVQFLRHPLPFLQFDCMFLLRHVLFG